RPPAAPKADGSKATLRLKCSEPVDVRVSTVGKFKQQKQFTKSLKPGFYRVQLYRNGDKVSQMDVNLLPGQSVSIPCP
ncbi:MAG: hypothetical protein KC933_14510, partial [Myxococcales bacterium]|nr:hypothetical protein [Myxococcales bacterium]